MYGPHNVLPDYRPYGDPARGLITILKNLNAGDTITINGDVYTFGIDFTGENFSRAAASLVSAIRGEGNETYYATTAKVFRNYSAYLVGNAIVVFCSQPGTGGNAFTLATSTTSVQLSGATFTGGTTVAPAVDTDGGGTKSRGFDAVTTGSAYVALASHVAGEVVIYNTLSANLLVTTGGTGAAFVLAPGFGKAFPVVANANELSVKASDGSTNTLTFEYVD